MTRRLSIDELICCTRKTISLLCSCVSTRARTATGRITGREGNRWTLRSNDGDGHEPPQLPEVTRRGHRRRVLHSSRRAAERRLTAPRIGAVAGGQLPRDAGVELRVRQPRHHEPVLRADDLRHRGRRRAARHDASVDRIRRLRHRRDGQRDGGRDRRRGRRRRRRPRRPRGVQRPDRQGAGGGHPGALVQRRCPEQPARLRRPGPVRLGLRDGQAHRRALSARARSACSSPRPDSSTSSPASTAPSPPSPIPAPTSTPRTSPPAPTSPRSSTTSRRGISATRTPSGMFAVDAGSTQAVGQVVQSQSARDKRSSRPADTTCCRSPSRWSPTARSTSPSTSSRTCRGSCRSCTSTCTSCRVAWSRRPRPTPVSCSSTRRRPSCSSTRRAGSRATTTPRRSSNRSR